MYIQLSEVILHIVVHIGEYIHVSGLIAEKSPPWSEEECKNFEHALQMYDKNFHLIQKHKVSLPLMGLVS